MSVHLDHNATTPIRPEARALFLERLDALAGNPSSVHAGGRSARHWLDEARERSAAALGVHEDELVFTGSGTESINLAVLGSVRAARPGIGMLTTAIEHSAVLGAAEQLEREGRPLEHLGVDEQGKLALDALAERVRAPWVGLVSVMAANNEVGSVAPLDRIAAMLAEVGPAERPRFHTDAVQALGRMPLRLREWGIDLASFSLHKVGGPLGVGILYKRKGVALQPLTFGGGQEGALRPGTENVPAICAGALALELAVREQASYEQRVRALCCSFWQQLQLVVPGARLNGPDIDDPTRLANTLNIELPDVDGRTLVARLDLEGLEASAGSACASGSLEPSHVLLAMGRTRERARSGLRVSLGRTTSDADIHTAVEILRRTFRALR